MEWSQLLFPEYRLDWFGAGPSSPNKTGALLAILFVVSWWPALCFRWGFWLSLPLAFVSAVFLLQTESRGALVGAACGSVLLLSVTRFSVYKMRQAAMRRRADEQRPYVVRIVVSLCAIGVLVLYSCLTLTPGGYAAKKQIPIRNDLRYTLVAAHLRHVLN